MTHPLDNPAWHALTGTQRAFGRVGTLCARYLPNISPIAAVAEESEAAFAELAELTKPGEIVAVPGTRAFWGSEWEPLGKAELTQWVHTGDVANDASDDITLLGEADGTEMLALARLADPGPFEIDTCRLGTYVGIRRNGVLVAMAGERMKLPGFTEVSAVATRPGHEGRGYAKRLVLALLRRHATAGERAFLHVRRGSPSEAAAVRVYERLGFRLRRNAELLAARRR